MAKLGEDLQKAMEDAEDGPTYEALEDGFYYAELIGCDRSDAEGDSGYFFHVVKWSVVAPNINSGQWLWDRLSESPKSAWKLREFFDALGYSYDSDTDEMVEAAEKAVLDVRKEIIARGKRKGEWGNSINTIMPPTEENLKLVSD